MRSEPQPGHVRLASSLAWPLCALAIAGAVGVVALDILDRARIHSLHDTQPAGIVLPVSFSLLGAVIASRQVGNRIGWIFLLVGVVMPWESLGILYYERSVLSGGLPGANWAAWLSHWVWIVVVPAGLSLFAFLLFPSGHLPSPRWKSVVRLAAVASLVAAVPTWIDSTPFSVLSGLPDATNPIGIVTLGSWSRRRQWHRVLSRTRAAHDNHRESCRASRGVLPRRSASR